MYIGLQVARGIAALLVVLLHATTGANTFYSENIFNNFWKFGHIGVDFFFVLSGFIIFYVHNDDTPNRNSITTYIKKRLIRIYPPYLLITILLILIYNFFPNLSANNRNISIFSSLTLIPITNYVPALNVAWTLMHEMLFYCIFILFYFHKKVFIVFLTIWFFFISVGSFFNYDGLFRTFFLNAHNIEFMFGIISALVVKKKKASSAYLSFGIILLFTYIFFFYDIFSSTFTTDNFKVRIYLGITFMLITIGLCSIEKKIKYPRFFVNIGTASYSIYLLHGPTLFS